jgi:dihydrofolate synthase/folylpolyglutamate synthase
MLRVMSPRVTRWHFASLAGPRAAAAEDLERNLRSVDARAPAELFPSPAQALAAARERAGEGDKIVVFGSFLTVGEAMAWLKNNNKTSKR